ncbi:ATP-binding protein [Ruania rhizosphaerae]|uniref:ATP-binding protein n=1 Tax=Ruania rhizosphaerae TaxID=1840413 RepID=UPI00135B0E74|nr:ATP-binding protein [Ruania rhizosphaerae]
MLRRHQAERELSDALRRSPVVLLVGARQVGKTTLARRVVPAGDPNYFDLEDPIDLARLDEPMLALRELRGTVVIDEVQRRPDLFPVLRVLADRDDHPARFLVLGSASPGALRQSSESLAGRVEVVELRGLGPADRAHEIDRVWVRGGYPRSLLAGSDTDSLRWRESYVRALASHDLADFGLSLPAATIERFLGLVAHQQGNLWNAASIARALDMGETTARRYLDGLQDAMLIRVLLPWHANLGKRLVRSPKVYFRDTGILHALWGGVPDRAALLRHIGVGSSWETFVIEEILRRAPGYRPYFWRTSNGAELDLLLEGHGKRLGFEIKRADAPRATVSMRSALADLDLDRLSVVYPGERRYAIAEGLAAVPLTEILDVEDVGEL